MRQIETLYCDDVRKEAGNRMSYMGVYDSEMIVPSFPVAIQILHVVVTVKTPKERPFKRLELVFKSGESVLAHVRLPEEQLAAQFNPPDREFAEIVIRFIISFNSIVVRESSDIGVTAITEEGELLGNRLQIRSAEVETQPLATVDL